MINFKFRSKEFCIPQVVLGFLDIYSFEGILESVHSRSSVLCYKVLTNNHDLEPRELRDSHQNVLKVSSHLLPRSGYIPPSRKIVLSYLLLLKRLTFKFKGAEG